MTATASFLNTKEQKISTTGFPLAKGNYWLYQGKVKWDKKPNYSIASGQIADYDLFANNLKEKAITFQINVLETYQSNNIKVALLDNDFRNLSIDNFGGNSLSRAFVIISVDDKKYYLITDEEAETVISMAKSNNFDFNNLGCIQEEYLMLSLPLKLNSHFGRDEENNTESISDNKGFAPWCWNVMQKNTIDLNISTGLNIDNPVNKYLLSYGYNNGLVKKQFVSGVGFTEYISVYHGPSLYEKFSLNLIACKVN
jgi:hypothetical protein